MSDESNSGDTPQAGARVPIWESPWYWIGLFGVGAVLAVVIMFPKYQKRRTELDREFQGREHMWRQQIQAGPGEKPRTSPPYTLTIWPLALAVSAVILPILFTFLAVRRQQRDTRVEVQSDSTHEEGLSR